MLGPLIFWKLPFLGGAFAASPSFAFLHIMICGIGRELSWVRGAIPLQPTQSHGMLAHPQFCCLSLINKNNTYIYIYTHMVPPMNPRLVMVVSSSPTKNSSSGTSGRV